MEGSSITTYCASKSAVEMLTIEGAKYNINDSRSNRERGIPSRNCSLLPDGQGRTRR